MKMLHPFVPPLAVMLMAASAGAGAQGVLIDRSEIRFVAKQMGGGVEGRFRKWKANVDFRPKDLPKSKAVFEIELASIDLASEETETEAEALFSREDAEDALRTARPVVELCTTGRRSVKRPS